MKCLIFLSILAFNTSAFADTGMIREFTVNKGFGFITPDNQSKSDVFVHLSEVEKSGYTELKPGQCVSYYVGAGHDGRERAIQIAIIPCEFRDVN